MNRVVVTGLGIISPVGNDVATSWENISGGVSGAGVITHFDASGFNVQIAAEVKDFDPKAHFGRKEYRRMDRFTQFAIAAATEAIADARLSITDENRDQIGCVLGTGIGGIGTLTAGFEALNNRGPGRINPFLIPMMIPDAAAGFAAIHFNVRGPNHAVVSACASGSNAIGEAANIIRQGTADVMITGGSEAAIFPISMGGLGVMKAMSTRNDDPTKASRPFDADRNGFLMGEGAGILILESLEHALARNAPILAELTGYGTTNDAHHVTAPSENGIGAARCMQRALDDSNLKPTDIGYINAHGTSTPLNDKSETAAIKTVFGPAAYQTPISSTKSMTGHLLGASGAIEAIFAIKALMNNILPPTINLQNPDPECDLDYVPNVKRAAQVDHVMSNSFGFGGHNATVIFSSINQS